MKKFYTILIVFLAISISLQPIFTREIQRNKRDLGTVLAIVGELAPVVYQLIRDFLKKEECNKIGKDMVNDMYNNNMENALRLKESVTAMMPEAGEAIHMKATGFYCDNSYCDEMGANSQGTLGICSKQYCICKNGIAQLEKCGLLRVYCPMTAKCTWTWKAMLCH